ncbi:MAG TPA: alpha/beta hydrolase [Candidatus Limnocylindria bacterium]|nr:alpha/beta hydrolase [Candidatus Limnocylindria bacterium]
MPASQTTVRGPAGTLATWEWPGSEPAALLLHGIGNYGRVWDFVAADIAGRLRLVAPDARGHGESVRPASGYAPEDFVADAVAVMDATGMARPLVVGHSMGGAHAMVLAATHPDRVRALALVDVGPEIGHDGGDRARRLSLGRPGRFADDPAALAYLRETSPGYSDAVYANRMEHVFRREPDGALVWRSSKDALLKILSGPGRSADAWRTLATLPMPVLVIRGTRSPSLSAATYQQMLETIPHVTGIELDAGHNVQLDRPAEVAAAIVGLARAT